MSYEKAREKLINRVKSEIIGFGSDSFYYSKA